MSSTESNFEPNPEVLKVLLSMGISENQAFEALFCTGNTSADAAINYLFADNEHVIESTHIPTTQGPEEVLTNVENDEEWHDSELALFKMTFVVNNSLKMGIGKIAAQVGHACLGLYREMVQNKNNSSEVDLNQWEEIGEKKIVLKGNDTDHLMELYKKAKEAKVPAYLVRDAGRTQIPSGSLTVLSLFGLEEHVDKITGKLSLL